MDTDKYLPLFLAETREHLQKVSQLILQLVSTPSNPLLDTLMGAVHSIKGMAATMGFKDLKDLCHRIEDLLQKLRKGTFTVEEEVINLLLRGVDSIESMLDEIQQTGGLQSRPGSFLEEWDRFEKNSKPAAKKELIKEKSVHTLKPSPYIRVEAQVLDRLIGRLEEVLILNNQLGEVYPDEQRLSAALKLVRKLYEDAVRLRTIPMETLYSRFPRTIYDLGQQLGKEIEFVTEGGELLVDRSVLDLLADPLIHLIRNAVAHGIETRSERIKGGKKTAGRIYVKTERKGDRFIIIVEDDGRGLEPRLIQEQAVSALILDPQQALSLTEQEIFLLLTRPGFTTLPEASDVAGRGIGLDLVRRKVEQLGGKLKIFSQLGDWTRFEITVPFSAAVIPVILVRSKDNLYGIPLSTVEKFLQLDGNKLIGDFSIEVLSETLERVFTDHPKYHGPAVVTEHQNRRIAWMVDELIDVQEILLRPLGEPLNKIGCYSGVTILSKGEIVPVLDMEQLYKERYA